MAQDLEEERREFGALETFFAGKRERHYAEALGGGCSQAEAEAHATGLDRFGRMLVSAVLRHAPRD